VSTQVSVSDCILTGTNAVVVVGSGALPQWTYNDTFPAKFAGMGDPTGHDGNISADPLLVQPDLSLAANSPARDAGDPALRDADGTAADMGATGGP